MGKGSFILYDTDLESVLLLPPSKAGKLFHAIANYRLKGTKPDFGKDLALSILYNQISEHISINEARYKEICEKRSAAASKRWSTENAKASKSMQMHTKGCLYDNDNDTDNDNDNVNDNVNDTDNDTVPCGESRESKRKNNFKGNRYVPVFLRDEPAYDAEAFMRRAIGLKYDKTDKS